MLERPEGAPLTEFAAGELPPRYGSDSTHDKNRVFAWLKKMLIVVTELLLASLLFRLPTLFSDR